MLELLRTISLRHVRLSRARSLLVVFGIALGVATLIATVAVNHAILGAFEELVERVGGKADLVVTNGEIGVPAEVVEALHDVPGVAHAAGSLEITTRTAGEGGPILVLGVDFLGDRYFSPMTVEGGEDVVEDPFAVVNDPSAILVSRTLARDSGVGVGGKLELLTPDGLRPFVVRGVLADEGVAAAFGGRVALMFTEAAQEAFARVDRLDRVELALADRSKRDDVEARVKTALDGRGVVERPERRTSHLQAIIQPIRHGLLVGGGLALLVGMFIIYNAVGVAVAQRQREIGVLRAIGVTRGVVVRLFVLEALALALVGGIAGLGLAHVLARLALAESAPVISRFYAPIHPARPAISLELALLGLAAGLAATLVAAYFPARLAAAVDPVEPLRRSTRKLELRQIPHGLLFGLGALIVVPALLVARVPTLAGGFGSMALFLVAGLLAVPGAVRFLRRALAPLAERLLGLPGRLAIDNAERSLGRSALTVGALMTSVCSSVAVGSWGTSLQDSMHAWLSHALPADLYVTSGSFIADQHNVPFRPEIVEALRGLPGVHAMYPVRVVSLEVRDKRVELVVIDQRTYHQELARKNMSGRTPLEGPSVIDPEVLVREPALVVGENAARKLGLHAGDTLEVDTSTGRHTFRIYAVVADYTSDQGSCLIDRRWYVEYWRDELVDTVDLFVDEGVDLAALAKEVRARLGRGDLLFVVTAADLREEIRKVISQALAIFDSTDLLALMVALLGVIGTMLAAVFDRTREIGVLRALGATRAQVVQTVVVEAGFLGLAAVLMGLLVGVPMGFVFVREVAMLGTGWRVDYVFPTLGALRIAVLVVGTAALAGLYPGRRAAGLDVPEALAYE